MSDVKCGYWGEESGKELVVTSKSNNTVEFEIEGKVVTLDRWRVDKLIELINNSNR